MSSDATFTCADLEALSDAVVNAWRAGADCDWRTITAGTLEWTCAAAADHAVDTVFAAAFFLASRNQDGYPSYSAQTPGPDAEPSIYIEELQTATRVLVAVVQAAPADATAVIWRRPRPELRGPVDFAPRGGMELALHAHDVCAGLGVRFVPPLGAMERLRRHVQDWPYWPSIPTDGWQAPTMVGDPWDDLLHASGRGPALR